MALEETQYAFYHEVLKQPMLGRKEELALWHEYKDPDTDLHRREDIRNKIITAHLPLCFKIARAFSESYKGANLGLDDFFEEGVRGLYVAIEKFELGKGARFSTYARWDIKDSIQQHIRKNSAVVPIGTTHFEKYLITHYNKLSGRIRATDPYITDDEVHRQIALKWLEDQESEITDKYIQYRVKSIETYLGKIRSIGLSLNAPVKGEGGDTEFQDFLPDDTHDPDDVVSEPLHEKFGKAFLAAAQEQFLATKQGRRRWDVLSARRLQESPETLEEVAERLGGISRERVRQIEEKALRQLYGMAQAFMRAAAEQKAADAPCFPQAQVAWQPPPPNGNDNQQVFDDKSFIAQMRAEFIQEADLFDAERAWEIYFRHVIMDPPEAIKTLAANYNMPRPIVREIVDQATEIMERVLNDGEEDRAEYIADEQFEAPEPEKLRVSVG